MSKLSRNEKAMLFAQGIVERYHLRGEKLPHRSKTCRMDPNRVQEYKDAAKLNDWKQSLKGNRGTCSDEIRDYLDLHIPNWRDVFRTNKTPVSVPPESEEVTVVIDVPSATLAPLASVNNVSSDILKKDMCFMNDKSSSMLNDAVIKSDSDGDSDTASISTGTTSSAVSVAMTFQQDSSMRKAEGIVDRYNERGNVLPRELRDHQNDPSREQEYRDAQKLNKWKQALNGKAGHTCPDEVRDFLDKNMPDWRVEHRKNYSDPMQKARDIVQRYKERGNILPRQFRSGNDPLRQQENKDARKLYDWKQALKGLRFYKCSDELKDYLDMEMPGWRNNVKEVHTNPMQKAMEIVERYHMNGSLLPRQYKNGTDPQRIQENKDAQKLYNWREALNGRRGKCSDAIRDYLDKEMPGWRSDSSSRHMGTIIPNKGSSVSVECQTDDYLATGDISNNIDAIDYYSGNNGQSDITSGYANIKNGNGKRMRNSYLDVENGEAVEEEENDEELRIIKQIKKDSELLLNLNSAPTYLNIATCI